MFGKFDAGSTHGQRQQNLVNALTVHAAPLCQPTRTEDPTFA